MTIRNPKQAAEEGAIFSAFLEAHPTFGASVTSWDQPEAQFPDVIVTLKNGQEIDFELGEWLHGQQMAQAMRRKRLVEAMENAIGAQGENASAYFRSVMLVPSPEAPRFDPAEVARFRAEMWALVEETEYRWPGERHWQSPQGRHLREFDLYPILGKYLSAVVFEPLLVAGERREKWAEGIHWIFVELPGGFYSPDTALDALNQVLRAKIGHYGGLSRPVRLLVYYGKAVAYNTPYHGIKIREFEDVAAIAAAAVAGQTRFERIYLLNALEPGVEAFEIFPGLAKCD